MGDDRVQVKFECNEVHPLRKQPSWHILPDNSWTVTDSESSINANRKSTMAFPTSHQPRSCQNGVQISKFGIFRINFEQKQLKVCYKVSLSKKFQQQSCSTINYLTNCTDIFAGDDYITIKFGPKGTEPQ